jgi:hypothetical protein
MGVSCSAGYKIYVPGSAKATVRAGRSIVRGGRCPPGKPEILGYEADYLGDAVIDKSLRYQPSPS